MNQTIKKGEQFLMGLNNFTNNSNNSNNIPVNGGNSGLSNMNLFESEPIDVLDYLINYNEKYKNSDFTMFRDEIIEQILAILIGKDKPNALLVGAAGVGKTKIVEDIAMRIENDHASIPTQLLDTVIYELPLSNLVAGSGIVGQVEEKVKALVDFVQDPQNKAILFIDEIHQLINGNPTYDKIAQILKPALSRGNFRIIGATTLQEARNFLKDPALNRRFSRVIVDELSREQTIQILKKVKSTYIKYYQNTITISDDILETVAVIADQYAKAGAHRPDTALTLLDRTCGDAIIAKNIKLNTAILQNNQLVVNALQQTPFVPITEKQIRKTALKLMTGHNQPDAIDKAQLQASLASIKGQDDILAIIQNALIRDSLKLYPRTKPLTFLFAGKSGVGKTEVAKIIAKELTSVKPITLNMTEYHSSASINRIIGSSAGYIGYDSNAELPFDILESNPYQIILLDEFEKADRSVQRLFMNAFEEGYIKTSKGQIIDFSKAIIIATTNASHSTGKTNTIGFTMEKDVAIKTEETVNQLQNWFDVELLNRFDYILTFNAINTDIYKQILQSIYKTDIARIKHEWQRSINLPDELSDADLDNLTKQTYVLDFGARPCKKIIREYIENKFL